MRELKLKAVGSSPLIAEEIKSVVQSFLGEEIFIDTATTKEVKQIEVDTFYICAKSQENFLRTKIPAENLFVFDLFRLVRKSTFSIISCPTQNCLPKNVELWALTKLIFILSPMMRCLLTRFVML